MPVADAGRVLQEVARLALPERAAEPRPAIAGAVPLGPVVAPQRAVGAADALGAALRAVVVLLADALEAEVVLQHAVRDTLG